MLDRDIAELYGVETKRLKEQVKRNIERFPEDFMFELSTREYESEVAFCDLKLGWHPIYTNGFHRTWHINDIICPEKCQSGSGKYPNYARFHEDAANDIDNAELRRQIDELRADTDGKFRIVFETFDQLLFIENKPKKKIGFMAKEKQAEYGKGGNRKNERNA